MAAKERLNTVARHLNAAQTSDVDPSSTYALASSGIHDASSSATTTSPASESAPSSKKIAPCDQSHSATNIPLKRHQVLKWNGWGYRDSQFIYDAETQNFKFTGDRYLIGNKILPHFRSWCEQNVGVDVNKRVAPVTAIESAPPSNINRHFLEDVVSQGIRHSLDPEDRIFRSHGHTLQEIFALRQGQLPRIPDLVVWPQSHQEVVTIVNLACKHDIVLIPFGGGTSVSLAVACPLEETRPIVSVDTQAMNKILWVDHHNLTARIESGIIGQDLERELAKFGYCTGHEPDSFEFSSLGGWVATRASGMKKNIYGNIEDLLVHVKIVTPQGVVERNCQVPRISAGPDIQQFILGSEGTIGIITEVVLKIRPLPECRRYGSVVFNDFDVGVDFMREVARQRLKPASIRLMDNEQFIFGQALKPEGASMFTSMKDSFKKFYVTKIKGFDISKMCVTTLLFEGTKDDVELLEEKIYQLAERYGGLNAGEENGKRGYMLTFSIAYIRDFALDFGIVAESFETSVPWDRCLTLCKNVKDRVHHELRKRNIVKPALVSCRVTQTYDAGACVYFYFGFNYLDGHEDNPVHLYEEIETAARDEILANGGSISHHHGVGKIRKRWLQATISQGGVDMMRAIKTAVDPKNIFANGNLIS